MVPDTFISSEANRCLANISTMTRDGLFIKQSMTRLNLAQPPAQDSLHMKKQATFYWHLSPFTLIAKISAFVIIGFLLPGCAVYYRDRDSGAEHIWGFGHLSMKVVRPAEEKQALIQRTTLTGIAIGLDNGSFGLSAGWDQREHILIYDANTVISIQRPPTNDFFYFKIGTYPPDLERIPGSNNSNEKKGIQP